MRLELDIGGMDFQVEIDSETGELIGSARFLGWTDGKPDDASEFLETEAQATPADAMEWANHAAGKARLEELAAETLGTLEQTEAEFWEEIS